MWWPQTDFINAFTPHWQQGTDYEYGILNSDARTAIHLTHRIGALVVFLLIGGLAIRLIANPFQKLQTIPRLLAFLLVTQVTLGILNVKLSLPISIAVLTQPWRSLAPPTFFNYPEFPTIKKDLVICINN